ncbi:MAG: zinc-binding dehydrogenase [Puia sp.]|nr:zinc-binding dehydrogenase [Puia sp.]
MKSLVLEDKDRELVLLDRPDPVATGRQAVVRILAAALNHRDAWIRQGRYAGLKFPVIPGSDGSGVVLSVGDDDDAHWVGQEVIINPSMGWGDSQTHQDQQHYRILGLPDDGTLSEQVMVPVNSLVPKPPSLSFEEAAALPLAGLTAFRALFKRGSCLPGERVLITGVGGGVASFALQFALAAGAIVYISSGSPEKIEKALALGATAGVDYKDPGWVQSLQRQAGDFDLVIDGAAGEGVAALLQLTRPGGRLVFYGATRGNPTGIDMRRIFWKQLNILGSTMGSPEDFSEMIAFVDRHGIHPVIDTVFSMEEGETALRRMDDGRQFGKIIIKIP